LGAVLDLAQDFIYYELVFAKSFTPHAILKVIGLNLGLSDRNISEKS
jgi:hypothetical protein